MADSAGGIRYVLNIFKCEFGEFELKKKLICHFVLYEKDDDRKIVCDWSTRRERKNERHLNSC